jgi:hypothetical protein
MKNEFGFVSVYFVSLRILQVPQHISVIFQLYCAEWRNENDCCVGDSFLYTWWCSDNQGPIFDYHLAMTKWLIHRLLTAKHHCGHISDIPAILCRMTKWKWMLSFRFVSIYFVSHRFRFVSVNFVSFGLVSVYFVSRFVSHFTGTRIVVAKFK